MAQKCHGLRLLKKGRHVESRRIPSSTMNSMKLSFLIGLCKLPAEGEIISVFNLMFQVGVPVQRQQVRDVS